MSDLLPIPQIDNWQQLYKEGAQARCIKDDPPMKGFGRALKIGDVVDVQSVCYEYKYQISVEAECAFYDLEGYFEVVPPDTPETHSFEEYISNKLTDILSEAEISQFRSMSVYWKEVRERDDKVPLLHEMDQANSILGVRVLALIEWVIEQHEAIQS